MEPHSNTPQALHLPQPTTGQGSDVAWSGTPQPATASDPHQGSYQAGIPPTPAVQADEQSDALDQEWIAKAKMIVEQTKQDPYLQSKELSKVKADYLRIRFNKHIKVSPEQKA